MKNGIYTLDDIEPAGKVTLCRLDLNSPLDRTGKPLDITRIERCLPTIKELSAKGARLVLMSHQGGDLEYQNYGSTEEHARLVERLTGIDVSFVDDVCGPAARNSISSLEDGEILMLDNVRYMAEELTLFETRLNLSFEQQAETLVVRKLAPLGDLFVCDAFAAAHRSQPTLVGFPQRLPSVMGRLFEEEFSVLSGMLIDPARPCLFMLGGSKIQDAFMMMPKVLGEGIADEVLTSGLLANIMLIADGRDIGKPSEEYIRKSNLADYIDQSKKMLADFRDKIVLPVDVACAGEKREEVAVKDLPVSKQIVDLGSETVRRYVEKIKQSGTVFINGPAGMYEQEQSAHGTMALFEAAAFSEAFSVVGGGDSISVVAKQGLDEHFSYVCTGGGAMVRFIGGEELPVVEALRKSAARFSI